MASTPAPPPYFLVCGRTDQPRPYRVREIKALEESDRLVDKYKLRTDDVNYIAIMQTLGVSPVPEEETPGGMTGMIADLKPIVVLRYVDGQWRDIFSAANARVNKD